MTEEKWMGCTDPILMLEFLRDEGTPSDRKLRLFAAACCRRAWHLLDADARALIETSERLADALASEAELMAAVWASRGRQAVDARAAVDHAAMGSWRQAVALLATVCSRSPDPATSSADNAALDREQAAQAHRLRCVFGPLPYRSPRLDPRWRTPQVLSLARGAYEERVAPDPSRPGWLVLDQARLLVLADALEDAGCDDEHLLAHLRHPGPHWRGCFALDAARG